MPHHNCSCNRCPPSIRLIILLSWFAIAVLKYDSGSLSIFQYHSRESRPCLRWGNGQTIGYEHSDETDGLRHSNNRSFWRQTAKSNIYFLHWGISPFNDAVIIRRLEPIVWFEHTTHCLTDNRSCHWAKLALTRHRYYMLKAYSKKNCCMCLSLSYIYIILYFYEKVKFIKTYFYHFALPFKLTPRYGEEHWTRTNNTSVPIKICC